MYLSLVIKIHLFLYRFLRNQDKFNKKYIDNYLQAFELHYNSRIRPDTRKQIINYYSRTIPVICASYASIYGRKLSAIERENATLAAIVTTLIDEFTDKKLLPFAQLNELVSFSSGYLPNTLEEAVVKDILGILIKRVTSPEKILNEFRRTLNAQHWSEKQFSQEVPEDEILGITYEKGGSSFLLLHYLIRELPDEKTCQAINQMGGALQLCNDIFDVYKDFHEGVNTLPSRCDDYGAFEKFYLVECRKFTEMAAEIDQPEKNIRFFVTLITLIMARGTVALRKLAKLQRKSGGGPLPLETLPRKELICDMEKPLNFLKAITYAKHMNKVKKKVI